MLKNSHHKKNLHKIGLLYSQKELYYYTQIVHRQLQPKSYRNYQSCLFKNKNSEIFDFSSKLFQFALNFDNFFKGTEGPPQGLTQEQQGQAKESQLRMSTLIMLLAAISYLSDAITTRNIIIYQIKFTEIRKPVDNFFGHPVCSISIIKKFCLKMQKSCTVFTKI